jgi:hypothetical protein
MQINIRTAQTGGGGYTTIADDGAGDVIDFRVPQLSTEEYITSGYGATGKFVQNMGNALWTVTIPVRKFYATSILARQAIATLGAALNAGNLDVQFLEQSAADATYLPACSAGQFTPDPREGQTGVALYFTLKFTGPNYTAHAP